MAIYATTPEGFKGYSPYKLPAECQAAASTVKTWPTKAGHVLEHRAVIFNGVHLDWIRMQRKVDDDKFQCQVEYNGGLTFCAGKGAGSNCTNILKNVPVSTGLNLQWADKSSSGSATDSNGVTIRATSSYNFIGPFSIQVA